MAIVSRLPVRRCSVAPIHAVSDGLGQQLGRVRKTTLPLPLISIPLDAGIADSILRHAPRVHNTVLQWHLGTARHALRGCWNSVTAGAARAGEPKGSVQGRSFHGQAVPHAQKRQLVRKVRVEHEEPFRSRDSHVEEVGLPGRGRGGQHEG